MLERRKKDGSKYPPRNVTLHFIVCGALRHLREENIQHLNFLDEYGHLFAVFRKVLDVCMKGLLSKGLGAKMRKLIR